MACKICGKSGGYKCPVCDCDYCEEHYLEYVTLYLQRPHRIVNNTCQLCGDEL